MKPTREPLKICPVGLVRKRGTSGGRGEGRTEETERREVERERARNRQTEGGRSDEMRARKSRGGAAACSLTAKLSQPGIF